MDNDNLLDGFEAPKAAGRPMFLTVLCILTWIGSALVIGLNGYSYAMLSPLLKGWVGELPREFAWILWNMLVACIGALVCLLGSILMWNLRRWGFYIYVVGQVVPLSMMVFVLLITNNSVRTGGLELLLTAAWLLVPIGFVVMYALNLKHLRK